MESNFDKYIRKSSCNMHDCPYGYDISCRECVNRMIAEHDAKVREAAIEEFIKTLEKESVIFGINYDYVKIQDIHIKAKQFKEHKND